MAATVTVPTAFFFNNSGSPQSSSSAKTCMNFKSTLTACSRGLPVVKVFAQAVTPHKINGHAVDHKSPMETVEKRDLVSFVQQLLSGSSALFNTIYKAADKQLKLLDRKKLADPFSFGEIVDCGPVFRQNYCIRSYDLGPNQSASMQTLMNLIQETSLNQLRVRGILREGFGSTPEMAKRNLVWVITKLHIVVDGYPSWGDAVEVDSWLSTAKKNSIPSNCCIRDKCTGEIMARSTSVSVMMNKETRKISKFPEVVRSEMESFILHSAPLLDENSMKLPRFDDNNMEYIRTGLTPIWNDLDVNQHVSHVKYSGWMIQSVPDSILKSQELAAITLEFRRECELDNVLQSLTSVVDDTTYGSNNATEVRCVHSLHLESGAVVAKGWTTWRSKYANNTRERFHYKALTLNGPDLNTRPI